MGHNSQGGGGTSALPPRRPQLPGVPRGVISEGSFVSAGEGGTSAPAPSLDNHLFPPPEDKYRPRGGLCVAPGEVVRPRRGAGDHEASRGEGKRSPRGTEEGREGMKRKERRGKGRGR